MCIRDSNKANLGDATTIPIVGDLVPNIDAVLEPGGGISGSIQMYDGQSPGMPTISLYQHDGTAWRFLFSQWLMPSLSSPVITYTVSGLPTGTYRLSAAADHNGTYYSEYYLNAGDVVSATNIAVTAPSTCLLYTSPSPRDRTRSRMPSSA